MNKYRRVFLILAALLSLGMAGCVTPAMNKMIKKDAFIYGKSYICTDFGRRNKLVFIGDRYHYIFDVPVVLSRSVQSSFRKSFYSLFEDFRVFT